MRRSDQGDDRPTAEHGPASSGPVKKGLRQDFDARARAARTDFEAQLRQRKADFGARNEALTARTGRNLPAAIGIALAFAVVMLGTLLLWPPSFMVVAAFLLGVGVYELTSAMRFAGRDVPRIPSVAVAIAIVPAAFLVGQVAALFTLLGGIVLISVWRLVEVAVARQKPPAGNVARDLSNGLFVQAYISLLGACVVLLSAQPDGNLWVIGFILVVVAVDTGAYATGLNLGKHPMAPRISPKKTWEGFAGSVAASIVVGILVALFMLGLPWWTGVLLGVLISGSATLGDLTESMIKRDLGIKDISSFLPGHGGLLDRIDSILPSAAVAYVLYLIVNH
ncbi:phosphatidate cytidylyltransferase [Curtobacterium flaccumfaciens]|uniref:phosphatidate cytidylyltransferase n=1 Tax=Curtobacterium flaccumfaciens TaxID=2035 RepID=UPI002032B3DF|nr:phosphatidate cytidylyltransferase [Curtobacterium flaccumfaciens]MCS0472428.1 phosphatidate cytidylyltransferase [Curtobacterium flaccumfaciens pv. betae]MCS0474665.1 phosphatidate cytidylyltransferase [Curtobacterium flaccumfaciens pv. betae]MCS0479168.1 phosphatidate cytidylyltransferase [Curtobacterium flaccumfaciens pv. betae]MCS0480741.1 phosphatidate cytidylyltransferase [Curtobacterium flaccumfaciens pv. betae]MCS0488447.1 phosphatidate cytidylyltransferase [Curtobacterium flaccumfa